MQPTPFAGLWRAVPTFALGLVVGALGTVMHRSVRPWGVVVCLLLVLASGVTARAWARWPGYVGWAGGLFLAVQVLVQKGPGGDVLVPGGGGIGWVWIGGALALLVVVGLLPRRLFSDEPLPPRTPRTPRRSDVAGELPGADVTP